MKRYKTLLDIVLLGTLAILTLLTIAPKTVVMPTSLQMILLALVLCLVIGFLVILWREKPGDEREAFNQAMAGRLAYFAGVTVLIIALVFQSLHHQLDPAIPIALLAMIFTKVIVQRTRDGS